MLLLFDVDGTLLHGVREPVGQALLAALSEVHGVDRGQIRTRIETEGRTDGEIARAILIDAGIPRDRIDAFADRVRERSSRFAAELLADDLSEAVLPGVRELLDWLSRLAGVRLGLLTGNYETIARLKLARAGIGGVFPPGQGAFGSDAEDRAALPAIARRRAGTAAAPYPRHATIVIGDTPRDIAGAQADGVRCVAVATGSFTARELAAADAVASDAFELRRVLTDLGIGSVRPAPAASSRDR